jgi:transcriptional regulator with PAS, ATPase and Fis domain
MVELTLPSLKDRSEDILLLAKHFIQKFSADYSKQIEGMTPRASVVLQRYEWPGNVRELEHVIGRACMLTDDTILDVDALPGQLVRHQIDSPADTDDSGSILADQERRLVVEALQTTAGNQSEAARRLGIGRDALRYKMKRYGLS